MEQQPKPSIEEVRDKLIKQQTLKQSLRSTGVESQPEESKGAAAHQKINHSTLEIEETKMSFAQNSSEDIQRLNIEEYEKLT